MQGTNWLLTEIRRVIRETEDYKGRGKSRYLEEQQMITAYNRIKELCGDESEGQRNRCM